MKKFEFRPWGWFLTLDEGSDYKVKKIYVKPKSRFSLQYHLKRDEYWTIIQGSGIITYEKDGNDINQDVNYDQDISSSKNVFHKKYGNGLIISSESDTAEVKFENFGIRKVYIKYLIPKI